MITLVEAEDLREQFRPAFAGILADGDVSDRDVLATLLDLYVRGYLELGAERKGKHYLIDKVIYSGKKTDRLMLFEKDFLNKLFKEKRAITLNELRFLVGTGILHDIIEENLNTLKDSEIVKAGLEAESELEDVIPYTKKKYEELLEFMQEYVLGEQNMYSEFMPFAVAFGLEDSWKKSFKL